MGKIKIFAEPILFDFLNNQIMDQEINKVLNEEEKKNYQVKRSGVGGFQTKPIDNEIICKNILKKCFEMIKENFNLREKINFKLLNLWINKNKKHDFNIPHIHPRSNFSGVYYYQTTNDGHLIFIQDNTSSQNGNSDFFKDEEFNNKYYIKPEKNKIVLFPSGLMHMVEPHTEENNRISVSFNIGLTNG